MGSSAPLNALERSRFSRFSSLSELETIEAQEWRLPKPENSEKPCFSVRVYKSGEITGAYYLSGNVSRVKPPVNDGPLVTTHFKQRAKNKIRRAVENSAADLCTFLTLTFSPWSLRPWEIMSYYPVMFRSNSNLCAGFDPASGFKKVRSVDGSRYLSLRIPVIRHDYAKYRLKNFRQALTMKINRQIACKLRELPESEHHEYTRLNKFRMLWTAELHKNGNIHFHMMTNKYIAVKYLNKVWPWGYSDIKKLRDAEHAANYMVKYLSKDENSAIQGNRYNISALLREESKPMYSLSKEDDEAREMKRLMGLMKESVESRGGKVIDSGFGFSMPKPKRSKVYRDKKDGHYKKTRGVDRRMHKAFLDACFPTPF